MKILFEFSRAGLPKYIRYYSLIKEEIVSHGHELTNDLLAEPEKILPESLFIKLSKAISSADCVVIEGSIVSLSLGYVLTEALALGKPVLFLIKETQLTSYNRFAHSIRSRLLINKHYKDSKELKEIVKDFFENNDFIKTRFNLVLPNNLNSHVATESKERKISKTEYILNLIEADKKSK